MAMLNGLFVFALGMLTLLGNNFVFTPSGYGPDRVAIASLLGPFAPRAGWVLLSLGLIVVLVGYGLFALKSWARYFLLAVLIIVALATVVEIVLGFNRSYWGVVIGGAVKLAFYAVLIWYFNSGSVKRAFSGVR
jgi:hypothetical protein